MDPSPPTPSWLPAWTPPPGPPVGPPPATPVRAGTGPSPVVVTLIAIGAALAGAAVAGVLMTALFLGNADDIGRELGAHVAPALEEAVEEGMARSYEDLYGAVPEDAWSSDHGPVEQFPAVAPGDLGPDPVLDGYAERCFAGELQSCDDLYFESPPLSDYEEYSASCGGRVKAYTVTSCTELD